MTRTAVAAPAWEPSPKRLLVIRLEETITDLMGYVSLWNDVHPIIEAARAFMTDDPLWDRSVKGDPGPALTKALKRYAELYPEHHR